MRRVAAIGATTALINLILNVFIGLSVGVSVCVGKDIGAKQDEHVSKEVHTSAALGVLCGIFVGAFGVIMAEPLLKMIETPTDILPSAVLYVRIFFVGAPASLLFNFLSAALRANGNTKTPFYILTISGAANVILNIIFVFFLKMGVAGVAIAMVLSQYLSAVLVVLYMSRDGGLLRLERKKIRFTADKVKSIVREGLPSGIQGAVFSL